MTMAMTNYFVPLLLSFLVLSCSYVTVYSHNPVMAPSPALDSHHRHHHHHHHHHHAAPQPTKPPTHPPVHLPTAPPTKTPSYPSIFQFPSSFVAVQGVVFCKSCKHAKDDTLKGGSPLAGAKVKLVCNNTKHKPATTEAITDKNGYFFMEGPKTITTDAAHKCKVFLVSSPTKICSKASDLQSGYSGAILRPEKQFVSHTHKMPFVLFTVGPFAFEAKENIVCLLS